MNETSQSTSLMADPETLNCSFRPIPPKIHDFVIALESTALKYFLPERGVAIGNLKKPIPNTHVEKELVVSPDKAIA
jgi:hypothetical protein